MKELLKRCILNQQPVEMIYMSENGAITQRTVIIQELTETYIKAFCQLRKTKRTFKVANILSARSKREYRKIS